MNTTAQPSPIPRTPQTFVPRKIAAIGYDESLIRRLDRIIDADAAFNVGADSFELYSADTMNQVDNDYINLNKSVVLCVLPQSLLVKYFFNGLPETLEDFFFEITERFAIMCGDGKALEAVHFEAVKSTTRKWFAELLEKKASQSEARPKDKGLQ